MSPQPRPRKQKKPRELSVTPALENQTLNLIEGEALDLYATEYSADDLLRARRRAQKYMKMPELLDAEVIQKPDRKPDDQA